MFVYVVWSQLLQHPPGSSCSNNRYVYIKSARLKITCVIIVFLPGYSSLLGQWLDLHTSWPLVCRGEHR